MREAVQDKPREHTADQAAASARQPAGRPTVWERFAFSIMRGMVRAHLAVWGWHGLYVTARAFGTLEYLVNHKRRSRVRRMLKAVFGREITRAERRHWVREHFCRQRCDKVFYLVFDLLSTEQVLARFSIVNRHLLDQGLARGKGVYALLSHHGPHHVVGMIMSAMGYRVGGVRDPNEGAMRRYVQNLWDEKHPDFPRARILYSGDFVREIYRLLRDNCALGSALDVTRVRDPRLKTQPVQIFGETREFLTGTLQIALRCEAFVIQGFMVAEKDFAYRLELTGPMCEPGAAETPELLADVLQRYADNIVAFARKHPDHILRA